MRWLCLISWISKKLRNNLALHHFLAKRDFEDGYIDDVGVEVIGNEMLECYGLTVEEYIEREKKKNRNIFEKLYGEVIMELVNLQDDDIDEYINKEEMLEKYKINPLSKHNEITEKWIDKFWRESEFIYNGILIAASRVISNYATTKLLNN